MPGCARRIAGNLRTRVLRGRAFLLSSEHPASINDAALPPNNVAVCDTADDIPVVIRVAMMAAMVVDMNSLLGLLEKQTVEGKPLS